MNLNLIYEGKNYQFDIPNDVTINYIKEIASKIFNYEDKGLQLIFNENNLNIYDDKKFVNQLLKDNEKNITIHLNKKNISNKSNNVFSNLSIVNSNNNNEKYYKELKNKFIKIHLNYNKKINLLSVFKEKIKEIFDKLIIIIKKLRNSIIMIDNNLLYFYKNNNYDKLLKLFEENKKGCGLTEKDLKGINDKIQTLIDDYKYIITQKNFQINVNNFIELQIEKIKNFNHQFEIIQNNNNYDEIIYELDKIFEFSFNKNKNKNSKNNIIKDKNNSNLFNNSFDLIQNEKQIFELPTVKKSNSKEKNNTNISKKIKLIKKNENKKIITVNNKKIDHFLPDINSKNEDINLFDLKLFKSTHSKLYERQKNENSLINETSTHLVYKLLNKTNNKILPKDNNYKDLFISINDIKPKIMEKSEEKIISNKKEKLYNEKKICNITLKSYNQSKIPKLLIPLNKENSIIKSPIKTDRNEKIINNNSFKSESPVKTERNEKKIDINEGSLNYNNYIYKSPSKKDRYEKNKYNNTIKSESPLKSDRNENNINNNINDCEHDNHNKNDNLSILSLIKIKKTISNKSLIKLQNHIKQNKNEKEKEKMIQFKLKNQNENKVDRTKNHNNTIISYNESSPLKSKSNRTVIKILFNETLKDENVNSLSPIRRKMDKNFFKTKSTKSVKLFKENNIKEEFENFYKKNQENNKDEIQKLAKDLLFNSPYKNKINKEEIYIKKTLTDSKINNEKNIENNENSNNDCNSEKIENEGKKKKKKLLNKFDFII